jgi:hypothetical protein
MTNKKYHTVGTGLKSTNKMTNEKYHTVGTGPKSTNKMTNKKYHTFILDLFQQCGIFY